MNDIEKRIHRGVEQITPDVFQKVTEDVSPKLTYEAWLIQEDKPKRSFCTYAARTAAVLAACFVIVFGLFACRLFWQVDSVVEIDVNPSLAISVNAREKVVRLEALNADGVKILKDTRDNLKGKRLEKAVQVLVNTMVEDGFLNEEKNSVLISVSHEDQEKSARLEQIVADNVKEALSADEITGTVYHQSYSMDPEITKASREYEISPGKLVFIHRLIALRPEFTVEELSRLTISEITALLEQEQVDMSAYTAKVDKAEDVREEEPQEAGEESQEEIYVAFLDEDKTPKEMKKNRRKLKRLLKKQNEENTASDGDAETGYDIGDDDEVDIFIPDTVFDGEGMQGSLPDDGQDDAWIFEPGTAEEEKPVDPLPEEDPAVDKEQVDFCEPEGDPLGVGDNLGAGNGSDKIPWWESMDKTPGELRIEAADMRDIMMRLSKQLYQMNAACDRESQELAYQMAGGYFMQAYQSCDKVQKLADEMYASQRLDELIWRESAITLSKMREKLERARILLEGYAQKEEPQPSAAPMVNNAG